MADIGIGIRAGMLTFRSPLIGDRAMLGMLFRRFAAGSSAVMLSAGEGGRVTELQKGEMDAKLLAGVAGEHDVSVLSRLLHDRDYGTAHVP